jgi:hypothetical protein
MKIRLTLLAFTVSFLLSANVAEAALNLAPIPTFMAPEISVASSTSAIALLAGVLLLVGERTRIQRSYRKVGVESGENQEV